MTIGSRSILRSTPNTIVYLKRQIADVDAFRRDEGLILADIDYADGARTFQRGPLET